jgi:putative transposase
MIINRAYKFRIYPNKTQQKAFYREFAASKTVYNYFLNRKIEVYKETGENHSYYDCNKELTLLKKREEYKWIAESSSAMLQESLRDLESAYNNFFREFKKGNKKYGFPKEKKFKSSCRYSNTSCKYNREKHKIFISKIGWMKVIDYKCAFGKLMNMTVSKSKDAKWYISICVEQSVKEVENNSTSKIGIDVGIKDFLVDSNGNKIANPKFLEKSERKLKRLQRSLSRKQKGSNNRKKAKFILAKFHAKIANQRSNFIHQNSTKLVKENKLIAHENLNISGMVKNHRLAKSIASVSWYEFFRQLGYKASWNDCKIIKIGRFEPSSKTCNCCGYVIDKVPLNIRKWQCPNCNELLDRDINAAKNILKIGLTNI